MADRIDQLKIGSTSYDIALPADSKDTMFYTTASSTATPAQKFSKRVNHAIFEDEAPSLETIMTAHFDNQALADIVKNESVEVKNRVFKAVRDAGRDLTTVTAEELAAFVNAAKSALAELNTEVDSKDDFYSHLKYNPNIQV